MEPKTLTYQHHPTKHSQYRTLHFSQLNFIKFLLAQFSNLARFQWQPSPLVYQPLLPFYIVCKPAKGVSCPIIQVPNEDVKQYWSHYPALGHTTGYRSLAGLCATDHNNLLSLSVQSVSSTPQHSLT